MISVIGVDPGATGGIFALYGHKHGGRSGKMFLCSATHAETVAAISEAIDYLNGDVTVAMVEAVHAFPGQGVSSVFTFGERYGVLQGALLARGISVSLVHPKTWQKEFSLSVSKSDIPAGLTKTQASSARRKVLKSRSYDAASMLFPSLGFGKDQADAVMIAEYAFRNYSK